MKNVIAIILLLINTNLYSQLLNEDSTKIRWISVERTKDNEFLFSDTSEFSLLSLVKKANQEKKSLFFLERPEIEFKTKLYPSISNEEKDSSYAICASDGLILDENYSKTNSFSIYLSNREPLEASDGSDLTFWCDGIQGLLCFVYPPSTSFKVPLKDVVNIKIREEYLFNPATKKYEFTPVGFTFYPMYDNYSAYQLWVDINRLEKTYPDQSRKCIDYLREKKYKGTQYMQN